MSSWSILERACERRTIVASGLYFFVSKTPKRLDEDRTMVQGQKAAREEEKRDGGERTGAYASREARTRLSGSPEHVLSSSTGSLFCRLIAIRSSALRMSRVPVRLHSPLDRVSRITMTSVIPPHGLGVAGVSNPAFGGCTIVRLSTFVSYWCVHCMHRLCHLRD
jgi:hypothetical protein